MTVNEKLLTKNEFVGTTKAPWNIKTTAMWPYNTTLRGKKDVELIQRGKQNGPHRTSKTLKLEWLLRDSGEKRKNKGSWVELHSWFPRWYSTRPTRVDSSWCGETVSITSSCPVHSSPRPPSTLCPPPSLLHCVYESWPQKQLFDVVCGYGTVQLRIQFSRLTWHM